MGMGGGPFLDVLWCGDFPGCFKIQRTGVKKFILLFFVKLQYGCSRLFPVGALIE